MADEAKKPMPLFDNVIDSFRNGVVLDLRLKFAMDLLEKSPMYTAAVEDEPKRIAKHALDIAAALFEEGESRGLMKPLDDEALWSRLVEHSRRVATFQRVNADEARRAQDQAITVGRHVHDAMKSAN